MSKQYRKRSENYEPAKKITFTDVVPEKKDISKVKVSINNLNIRKGPGKEFERTGKFTGKGVFEIVERKEGNGSTKGWGKLKNEQGWISLEFCEDIE